MPRKLRVEYPGAMYHVMSRGDRREDIFLDDVDRQGATKGANTNLHKWMRARANEGLAQGRVGL